MKKKIYWKQEDGSAQLCLQNKICLVRVFVCLDVELYSLKSHKRFEVACYSKDVLCCLLQYLA